MQQYFGRIIVFVGGLALVLIGGVWKPSMPHAGELMVIGIAMITASSGYHAGQQLQVRRKQ